MKKRLMSLLLLVGMALSLLPAASLRAMAVACWATPMGTAL